MDELQALKELFSSPEPPPESVVQRQREKLMTIIEATTAVNPGPQQRPRRPRRRRAVALIVAPVATAALAAAGWAVLRTEATEAHSFACVTDGVVTILPNDGTSPVEACKSAWESGAMIQGVTTAPPLVACVNEGGAVEILVDHGPDSCDSAGMGEWTGQAEYEAAGAAVRAALVSFHDRLESTGNACATEADWRAALREQTAVHGWTIEVNQVEPDRHCFDVGSIDPTTKTMTLIGHPGDDSIGCDPRTGC